MPLWQVNTFSTQWYAVFPSCMPSSQIEASLVNVMPWDLYVCDLGGQNLPVKEMLASMKADHLEVPFRTLERHTVFSYALLSLGAETVAFKGDLRF